MKQLHLDQSENNNFCSYNHKIKNTLPLSNTLIMNHLLAFLLWNLEAVHSTLFPKTNSFSSRGPPATCLIPGWNTWQLSALQIKFFIPSLLSNTKHRTFIHTDWTRTYMNWTREQIGAPDITRDTKGTEYSCYKAQREISLCFFGTFSSLMMQFLLTAAIRLIINFLLINPFFSHA